MYHLTDLVPSKTTTAPQRHETLTKEPSCGDTCAVLSVPSCLGTASQQREECPTRRLPFQLRPPFATSSPRPSAHCILKSLTSHTCTMCKFVCFCAGLDSLLSMPQKVSTVCRILGLSTRRRTSRWWSFPISLILSKLRCNDIVSSIQFCGKSWRDLSMPYPLLRKHPNSGKQAKRLSLPHHVAEETVVCLQRMDRMEQKSAIPVVQSYHSRTVNIVSLLFRASRGKMRDKAIVRCAHEIYRNYS